MKQKLYALDVFFIEKLKLSENDPIIAKQAPNYFRTWPFLTDRMDLM